MEEKLVTLAIFTYSKAQILKNVLENEGIEACIHNVNLIQPVISSGVRIRIRESDLPRALKIIESSAWLAEDVVNEEKTEERYGKQVLIPVDFSDYSMAACEFDFSPVYMPNLQYATENYGLPMEHELGIKSMLDSIHEQFNNLINSIKERIQKGELPDVKYTCTLKEGVPEEEILHYAREEKPLIIIMGTRGKGEKEMDLIGSVTAEIIDRSPVFVYAIPKNAQKKNFDEIHKVAFFTSFDQRDLIAFDSLVTTFKDYHFEVSFIHLSDNAQKRTWNEIKLVGIQEYFKKQYPQLTIDYDMLGGESLLSNLDEYVKEKGINVLCLSNYKRNVFARLFNPSIARRMIFHSNTPILVIK